MAEPRKNLTLLSRMGFQDSDLTTPLHDEIMLWLDARLRRKFPNLESIIWEHPVKRDNFIIGYIDLLMCRRTLTGGDSVAFEVKTKIPSLGEVIRQIQTYRTTERIHDRQYVIVCPDDRFAAALKGQGIGFLKYDPSDEGEGR